jgi:hypothetical protein
MVRIATRSACLLLTLLLAAAPWTARANLLVNPGFETVETVGGALPTTTGDWAGDGSVITVGTENGVTPHGGANMLKFLSTGLSGGGGGSSDVWQLVDMTPFAAAIAAGTALAEASAFFNRVAGDAQTDTQFQVVIRAYSGSTVGFSGAGFLDQAVGNLISDGDTGTWGSIDASLLLPTGTTYVGFLLAAVENVFNDGSNEFDGHYADDAVFTVTDIAELPSPASLALLAPALFLVLRRRR